MEGGWHGDWARLMSEMGRNHSVLLVCRLRAETVGQVHPQQKEARSEARMKCDISRKPP